MSLQSENQFEAREIEQDVLNAILVVVSEDEHEACFDRSYYSDEFWKKKYGSETRQQAYDKSMNWHKSLSLKELLDFYGDRYDYILERMNYKI